MYVEIVVLTYQSPEIQKYTYLVPKEFEREIKVGQLVSVPFGTRSPFGVITSISQNPTTDVQNIKSVNSIVLKKPLLLPYQIKLLFWMSEYYFAPVVNCLEAMLPKIPKSLPLIPTSNKPAAENQTLILVPGINRIPQILANFPKAKNYALYHNELKDNQKFSVWQETATGTKDHIFGTRSAIFLPFPKLEKIIIYDEHEESYKDERSPYFDTLTIAEKLQELQSSQLKIIDSSPKITTYFNHKQNLQIPGSQTKTKIVSMEEEKMAGNRLPLSDLLADYIKAGFLKNKKILLFLNKKSASGHVYCRNCKYSEFIGKQPDTCPNCLSAEIWFNSLNVLTLKNLVSKIIPEENISVIAEGYKSIPAQKTVDIATAAVFYKLISQKYDLVAHIAADVALNIADFTSSEKTYSQITNLKKITKGLLLVQTYNPQNATIQNAVNSNYRHFYESQMDGRKNLSYPPFSLLIKISARAKKEKGLEEKAQKLFLELTKALDALPPANRPLPSILGPYKPFFPKNTAKYNIILKIPVADYKIAKREKAVKNASRMLSIVPATWQIQTEPENIND